MDFKVSQKRIPEDKFLEIRKGVLAQWPTGKEVDLKEAVEYSKNLPDSKNFTKVTQKLVEEGKSVVWCRAGTPILEDEIELVKTLVASGVRHVPVTTDSYSRLCQFDRAQQALEETIKTGKTRLNGYPITNYGVKNTRKLIESVDAAFCPRGAVRITMEIALASGMTSAGKSSFLEFGSYEKKRTLAECISYSQYTDRLCGYYADRGAIISTDLHGWIPHGVFPLSVNIATIVIDSLISAGQGVKSVIPLLHCLGHLAQDVAWINITPRLVREYLDMMGYKDVLVPVFLENMIPVFPVPQSMGKVFAYINYTAMVAALGKPAAVHVRTIDEGAGVATNEAHAISYESATWILNVVREQKINLQMDSIKQEEELAEKEVRAILKKVFELGDGDIVIGAIKAVESGVLDSPFSSNIHAKDQVLGIRDSEGACRYLDFGNLPLPPDIKEFHRQKVAERENLEGRKMDYQVAVDDFWALSKGHLVGKLKY